MATLLTFHPGAFKGGGPKLEYGAVYYAKQRGFRTVNCDYPLRHLGRQWDWIRIVAGMVAKPVYAYGDSAGGCLAARLATLDLVEAAATYSAVPDPWKFFGDFPAVAARIVDLTQATANQLSPKLHAPSPAPILAVTAADDTVVPPADTAAWAAADPSVTQHPVEGIHLSGGTTSPAYRQNMRYAVDWLAAQAGL